MATLRYGEESLAAWPTNSVGAISAEAGQDMLVSQRSGGCLVKSTTEFTVPVTDGVATQINPLVASPVVSDGLWSADANNRQYPDYGSAISGLVIPAGYSKFAQVFWSFSCQKVGSGEDDYLFQLDNDGTPVSTGALFGLGTVPTVISLLVNASVLIDGGALLGLTVTGEGTSDDITIYSFEQFVLDFQIWGIPAVAQQLPVIETGVSP